ncbi:glycine, alanine and asparagine-rich protein-like [Amphibalanus amphitrite]|uniref:glycine, alanine and asparagine-rich protein-like n=1 Tax=Amphibalanus amphitrite TaxID=1232801 RepID=UPI001C90B9BF|nr:glycine, alanine and asparagine-rich protein-like [Amphibalanus amphitrite]
MSALHPAVVCLLLLSFSHELLHWTESIVASAFSDSSTFQTLQHVYEESSSIYKAEFPSLNSPTTVRPAISAPLKQPNMLNSTSSSLTSPSNPLNHSPSEPFDPLSSYLSPFSHSSPHRNRRGLMDLLSAASGGGYGSSGGGYGSSGGYGGGGYGGSGYSSGGYGSSCDCSGFDSIGLIAGASALAAVGAFLITQLVNNTGNGRELPDYWEGPGGWSVPLPSAIPKLLPVPVSEMIAVALPPAEAADRVARTCDVLAELEEEAMIGSGKQKMTRLEEEVMFGDGRQTISWREEEAMVRDGKRMPWRQVETIFSDDRQKNGRWKRDTKARDGRQKIKRREEKEMIASARSGGGGYGSCECFPGIAGAIAGFGALSALVAFAVARALTTTTTTTMAPAGTGGRAMDFSVADNFIDSEDAEDGGLFDAVGVELMSGFVTLFMTSDVQCVPAQLCQLNSRAQLAGYRYGALMQLASLPVSWLLMKNSQQSMTSLCRAVTTSSPDASSCQRRYPNCNL